MRTRVTLECTECKQRNYNMTKDKKTHPERMETKKYCKFCKTHTLHKETKAEFNRIIWPTKERIAKETAVVVICAIIIGVIVAVLDVGIQYGIQALVG